ncbi:sigma-70 family RNA polymerase sigma factor [Actinoplanes sp. NPDC024001]|uniref:RNA polymerase sigma factor n=1 Tax=Actinoplanes sp. NPDC024001 TaxID=3154598 RepID=UPI0033CDCE21
MRLTEADVSEIVTAAQHGDRRALDRLIESHLPLVYNIVRRALDDDTGVDDVVQNTMLRAVRDLRALRTPGSFRSWLAAIAVRQAGTWQHQRRAVRERTTVLDDAVRRADPNAGVEDVTVLRAQLAGERREVAAATRWLDPDDRTLLALWWQEVAGQLSRAELAEAAGLSIAHAGVRLQRMREQLDLARAVVAALAVRPPCPQLTDVIAGWDGRPGTLWRKRIARHARTCPVCSAAAHDRVPAERLLGSVPVLAVPPGLLEVTLTKTATVGLAGSAAPAE